MSKRSRGSSRTHRPGTRRPISRPSGARPGRPTPPADAPLDSRPTPLEVAPDVAEELAQEQPVVAASEARRANHAGHPRQRAKPGSMLAARAATEYLYVAQDIRRIVVVSALLFGGMIVVWLLLVVLQVIPTDLY